MTVGLRQGCVMLLWQFNSFMGGFAREWKARIMNARVRLNERDGRQCSVSSLLLADDAGLIAVGEERLQRMVNKMGMVCGRRKLIINMDETKARSV